jgi:hypothetical protein
MRDADNAIAGANRKQDLGSTRQQAYNAHSPSILRATPYLTVSYKPCLELRSSHATLW